MIHMKANTRRAVALSDDLITTGSVGIEVEILCSEAWDGLTKTVLFRGSGSSVDVILTGDSCTVPPEVLTVPGGELLIGLYGTDGSGSLSIPTVWADAGRILQGAAPSGIAPTPAQKSALDQAIEALQNATEEIPTQIDTALAEAKASGEFDGPPGQPGKDGDPGAAGVSPDVSVTTITGGHRVTITDAQGAESFDVLDGEKGQPGKDGDPGAAGVSPDVSVTTITGGHRVTITDAQGAESFDVLDGERGQPGKDGDPGDPGVYVGATEPTDPTVRVWVDTDGDADDPVLPTGGTAGQVLTLVPGLLPGSDPLPAWSDPERQTVILDFALDASDQVSSGPIWNDVDAALSGTTAVVAHVTKNDGTELFAPLVFYDDTPSAWAAKFSATNGYDGLSYSIVSGTGVANTWVYNEWDINADLNDLFDSKLDNNLGSSEAGKFLVVGSDGAITAVTMTAWQGGNY